MSKRDGFFRDIVAAVKKQGWDVRKTAKGHWEMVPPVKTAPIVRTSGTPSDPREVYNFLAQLRRAGFQG